MFFKMSAPDANESSVKKNCAIRSSSHSLDKNVTDGGGQDLARGQDMGPVVTKLVDVDNSGDITYYGICIPNDAHVNGSAETLHVYTDKSVALKVVKEHKKSRFKAFKTRQEAVLFAVHGSEIFNSAVTENADSSSPAVGEKPSPFRGPKAQDLVWLRKLIENGDIDTFRVHVWSNPRYLVSSGDTPAILQEGSRYNALHVAAKSGNAELCELVLQTVSNVSFINLLYGDDDMRSCEDRAHIMLDLYLNTPDKAVNETPLHFAVKFGFVSVVETLVSYPQCNKLARNKFGQTPRDVICARVPCPGVNLKNELSNLLDDRFYVPVLRSEDNSVQPVVGEPFSPACPLVLKADPINPRIEIRAYAGPMNRDQAVVFRKKWKTPPRVPQTPTRNSAKHVHIDSPYPHAYRFQDTEKGLERVGRDLASEFSVGWNEYWPFLDTFTNLASKDGLQRLESYLKRRFCEATQRSVDQEETELYTNCTENAQNSSASSSEYQSSGDGAISPMSDLCLAFKACSLSDENSGKHLVHNKTKTSYDYRGGDGNVGMEDEALLNVMLNPSLSPFLYVEKSCQVFAKRISDGLAVVGRSARIGDSVSDMLQQEIRHLQDLVNSFKEDTRFISVDFNLVHSRIATIVASKLGVLVSDEMRFVMSGLKSTTSRMLESSYSDDEDNVSHNYRNMHGLADHQRRSDSERSQMRCIAEHILSALENEQSDKELNEKNVHIQTEEDCMRIWSDAIKCSCFKASQNFIRNTRKGSSFKRNMRYLSPTTKAVCADNVSLDGITKRLSFEGDNEVDKSDEIQNIPSTRQKEQQSSESESSSDDDEYYTPVPSPRELSRSVTPSSSDDDDEANMSTPGEGPAVFIQGDSPSKLDASVMQALEGMTILPAFYPYICRWRHLVSLHQELDRIMWPSPSCSRGSEKCRTPDTTYRDNQRNSQSYTPPQAWHKITGQYSPCSPQQRFRNNDTDGEYIGSYCK